MDVDGQALYWNWSVLRNSSPQTKEFLYDIA